MQSTGLPACRQAGPLQSAVARHCEAPRSNLLRNRRISASIPRATPFSFSYIWSMKKLSFLFLVSISSFSKAQVTFQKAFGGTNYDVGVTVKQTIDGGYILACDILNSLSLIKTDMNGDTVWIQSYGGYAVEWGDLVHQTSDEGFILSGYISNAGDANIYIVKTSSSGTLLWSKSYGGTKSEWASSLKKTFDGGYIIAGSTSSFGAGSNDIYLIKLSSDGNIIWTKTYGTTGSEYGKGVQTTSDGGFIITGWGIGGAYLIKTNSFGDTLWTRTYGGDIGDIGWSILQTSDAGYVIGGTASFAGNSDLLLFKTDSSGFPQWSKSYGNTDGSDEGYQIAPTSDGGYILTGRFVYNFRDVALIKTNAVGDTLWTRIFGGQGGDLGISVQQTSDNGYIITGESNVLGGLGLTDIYLIKTDNMGNSGCHQLTPHIIVNNPSITVTNIPIKVSSGGTVYTPPVFSSKGCDMATFCSTAEVNEISNSNSIVIFPNPFSSQTILHSDKAFKNATLTLYNPFGQVVKQLNSLSGQEVILQRGNLPSGLYFIRLVEDNVVLATDKLVITDH